MVKRKYFFKRIVLKDDFTIFYDDIFNILKFCNRVASELDFINSNILTSVTDNDQSYSRGALRIVESFQTVFILCFDGTENIFNLFFWLEKTSLLYTVNLLNYLP